MDAGPLIALPSRPLLLASDLKGRRFGLNLSQWRDRAGLLPFEGSHPLPLQRLIVNPTIEAL